MKNKKQKKESLTARVHEALCAKWSERVRRGEMRPSEAAMSATDKSLARSLVRIGRKSKIPDDRMVELAREDRSHGA